MPTRILDVPTRILGPPARRTLARLPRRLPNRTGAHCALALAALVVGLEPLVVRSLGNNAPGWSHWLCSAHPAASGSHASASGWLGGPLHTTLALLAVHWPHFLPIVLALGTLVYLWRADAAWRADAGRRAEAFRGAGPSWSAEASREAGPSWSAKAPGPLSARTSRTFSG